MTRGWLVVIGLALAAGGGAWIEHNRMAVKLAKAGEDYALKVAAAEGGRANAEAANRQTELKIGELRDAERAQRDASTKELAAANDRARGQLVSLQTSLARAEKRASLATTNTATGPSLDGSAASATVLRYVAGSCAERYAGMANIVGQLSIQVTGLQAHARAVATPE